MDVIGLFLSGLRYLLSVCEYNMDFISSIITDASIFQDAWLEVTKNED